MPLTLLHGPAGSGKSDILIKKILQNPLTAEEAPPYRYLAPNQRGAEIYQKKILKESTSRSAFFGDSIMPIDRFFLNLLKSSIPCTHEASPRMVRQLIRKLLYQNNYSSFNREKNYFQFIEDLKNTFINLKKNGIGPQSAESLFSSPIPPPLDDFLKLFRDYEAELKKHSAIDCGDIYGKTLQLLRQGKLSLPLGLKELYIDRIFPFLPGLSEMMKELLKTDQSLEIFVAYSFDYRDDDDPFLYPQYTSLGETSQKNEYFQNTKQGRILAQQTFADPAEEVRWIVKEIRKSIVSGVDPDQIGCLLPPSPFYHRYFAEILEQNHIPFEPSYEPLLTQFIPMDHSQNHNEVIHRLHREIMEAPFHDHHKITSSIFAAASAREKFEEEWKFDCQFLFGPNETQENNPFISQWKEDELSRLTVPKPSFGEGIHLITLSDSTPFDLKLLFVPGYVDVYYPSKTLEHSIYSVEMSADQNLREILGGPVYRHSVEKNLLSQLIHRTDDLVFLTRPQTLWDLRQTTPSRLVPPTTMETMFKTSTDAFKAPSDVNKNNSSFIEALPHKNWMPQKKKKNKFSMTELETYQKCPYQYYARYHLKLGEFADESIDLPPDVKGSFVHRVFCHLFQNNLPLYRDAVDYDLYLDKLVVTAQKIAEAEALQDSFFYRSPAPVQKHFLKNLKAVLADYLKKEISLHREKKKKTYPSYFEWSFGNKESPPLKIKEGGLELMITGRIDRIDIHEKEKLFCVIDYKTGNLDSGAQIKEGESIQTPLYIMAVEQILLKDFKPTGALLAGLAEVSKNSGFFIRGRGEEEILGKHYCLSVDEWDSLKTKVVSKISQIAQKIHEGDFNPRPRNPNLCRVCDYREICHYAHDTPSDQGR